MSLPIWIKRDDKWDDFILDGKVIGSIGRVGPGRNGSQSKRHHPVQFMLYFRSECGKYCCKNRRLSRQYIEYRYLQELKELKK